MIETLNAVFTLSRMKKILQACSFLVLYLFSANASALSIELDGTRTVLTGTDCDIATYRFGTNASWQGTPIDLHVEVNAEDNEYSFGNCLYVTAGILSANIRDNDPGDNVAFIDVTITLVQQGTLIPVFVDRITATGFDLDANGTTTGEFATATDDIYLSGPGGANLSGITNVTYSTGSWPIGHDVRLMGDPSGNCTDSPSTPVPACRGSASWTGGTSNQVSTFNARFQNDNAYGQYTGTGNAYRLLQLSLQDIHAEEILEQNNDYGDAPVSYGTAWHDVLSLNTILGYGIAPDHETAHQPTVTADGDDNDYIGPGPADYDDEDAVERNGTDLQDQVLKAGDTITTTVTTFGTGYITAWFDFNRDGDFLDAGEKVINDTYINSTTVSVTPLSFSLPMTLAGGYSYARFRFNEIAGLGESGPGQKGEVEDYRIEFEPMLPAYNMVKTSDTPSMSAPGTITYTFTFTNTGNFPLSNLTLTDPDIDSGTLTGCPIATLSDVAPNNVATCTATRTVTQADIDGGGPLPNTASTTATDPLGGKVKESDLSDNTTSTIINATYTLGINKPAPTHTDNDTSGDVSAGDVLTYTITATNTGTATLTGVVVSDPLLTPSSTTCASVAPAGTCVLVGTYTVQASDIGGPGSTIYNTATADSNETGPVTDDETVPLPTPGLIIDKPAPSNADGDATGDISIGDVLTYTITATNNGASNLTNVTVSDSLITPSNQTCALVAPGATCVLTGTYTVAAADITAGQIVNTATADSDQTGPVTDDETVPVPQPAHTIDKTIQGNADEDSSTDISVGDTLTYQITATNTGTAILTNMVVSDPMLNPSTITCATVAPGATCVLSGTYSVTAADVTAGQIVNTATSDTDQTGPLTDTEKVDVPSPSLTIDKPAPTNADNDSSGDVSAGDVLTYTITATNNGTAQLTNVTVSDPLITPTSNTCALVAPGATCVLTGTYTVTATDVTNGAIDNTATADSDQTGPVTDDETVNPPAPAIAIDKTAPTNADNDSSGDLSAGDVLTYTVTATNTGSATLTNMVVNDPMLSPTTNTCASVAPNATCVLTGTYTITASDVTAGVINNTATANSDQTGPVDDTETVTPPSPALSINKPAPTNADGDSSGDISVGDVLTYTITATNTGTANLTNVVVSDPLLTPNSNTCTLVPVGGSCVLTGTYTVTASDITAGSIDNTATADSDQTGPVTDDETVTPPTPALAINKPAPTNADNDGSGDISVGDVLTYTVTATNTGTATLTNLVVSDPLLTPNTNTCASVAPNATCVLSGTYTVTAADITAGVINNTATADSDQTGPVTDDETVNPPAPGLAINKPAPSNGDNDGSTDVSVGDVLTYTITATNTGTAVLTNVVVNDPLLTPNSNTCASVAPNATCVLTGTYTVTAADVTAGVIDNTATADSDQTGSVDDDQSVPVPAPALAINKPAPVNADNDSSGDVSENDVLTYTITATNSGSAVLTNLVVSDPLLTPNTTTCASVAPGATCVLTGTYTVTAADVAAGVINNTATADSDQTGPVSDDETVNPPTPALSLDKAAPTNADNDSSTDLSVGDVLTYVVTATNSGTAVLTNLLVSDPLLTPNSTTCASVAPNATCVLTGTYTVTAADVAAGVINNTATADSDQTGPVSDDETVNPPTPALALDKSAPTHTDNDGSGDISAGDVLTYTITATNPGTAVLTNVVVSDPLLTPNSNTCATLAPVAGATCVLTGTYTVTAADVAAGVIDNTATANSDQTGPVTDDESVPLPTPAIAINKPAPTNADNDGSGDVSVGDVLTYTITATNTGTAVLTNFIVSDPLLTPNSNTCASVAPGATCVLSGTYTVTAADITAGAINNTATADSDQTGPVTDDETVNPPTPALAINKPAPTNADNDGSGDISENDVLTYTVTATNTGTAVLTNLVVSDPLLTPNSTTCASVAPNATCVLTGTYTVTAADVAAGVINNTATADSDQTGSVTDDETVNPPAPALAINKPAPTNADNDGSGDVSENDVLTYTVTATNTGTAVLTNLVVSDPLLTPNTTTCASVAPGATCVLSGTYTVTAADVAAGVINNTATADSDQTGSVSDDETVNPPAPALALDKTAPTNADNDGSGDVSVGDVLTYTITATNSGTAVLTNLVVSDPLLTPNSTTCATVAPTATCVLTGTYTVTAADVTAGVINNTATADSDQTDSVTDDETVNPPAPALALDKTAPTNADNDGSGDVSVGDVLTYTITATNSGTATLTNLVVSDPLLTPNTTTCASVAPNATCVLTGTYTVTAADVAAGVINNTATADSDQTGSVSDDETVNPPAPALALDKAAPTNTDNDGSTDISAGDVLTYTVTATNSGTATLTNVVVNDPLLTPNSITCGSVAAGATCVLTGTYTVTAADVTAGIINNTATADSDQTSSAKDDKNVPLPVPDYTLSKAFPSNADNDSSGDVSENDVLTYTVTATNTGTAVLTNLMVSDPLLTPNTTTCASVVPNATCVLTGTYTVTAADVSAGIINNTATADSDQTDPLTDDQTVNLNAPSIALDKPAPVNADNDGSGDISVGDVLTYTITATNTGASNLTNVVVSDPLINPVSTTCALVTPGTTCVLIGTYTVTAADVTAGVINNTATADSDQTDSVTDDETVNPPAPALAINKPAPTNGDNDGSNDVSENDVLTYTVTATNTGTAVLTNLVVSDPLLTPNTTTCASVAPGATCVLTGTYTVTAADVAAGVINNTATADSDQTGPVSDDETVNPPAPALALDKTAPTNADNDGSGDVSVGDVLTYTITATNSGTAVLTNLLVSDPLLTPNSNTCASVAPGATCVLTGTYTVTAADVAAGVINNTATADSDQTGPVSDDETVNPPAPALALDKTAPTNADNDGSGDVSEGDVLTYTVTATNSGTATLTNLVVSDPLLTPNSNTCASVAPGATCVLTGTYTVVAADVQAGVIDNTATADSDQTGSVTDDETVNLPSPAIALDKAAPTNADNDGSGDVSEGDVLTYTITATNSGTATMTNLVVSDPLLTPNTTTCATVAPGATCVLSGTYTVTAADIAAGVINNTATADSDQTDPISDDETVNPPTPALALDKTAPTNADNDGSGDISEGDVLTYTVTATNTGTATLTNLVVNDPLLTPNNNTCASVPVGATCVLTGTYTVTASDVAAGVINNTATADSDQTGPVSDDESVIVPTPAYTLNKSFPALADNDASGDTSEGDVLTYTITATNTGTAVLTNMVINDAMLTPGSTTCAVVAPGATCVLSGTYTVTAADVIATVINNTATSDTDQTDPLDDSQAVNLNQPSHIIDKGQPVNADDDGSLDLSAGDTLTYTITATNNGSSNLTNMVVTDPMLTPGSANCAIVPVGGTCVLTGTYVVTAADMTSAVITNTASSVTDQTGPFDDTVTVYPPQPALALDKAAPSNADEDGSGDVSIGDTLNYTITATNTGTANLTNVVVSDPLLTPNTITCAMLTPGNNCVLNGSYTVTAADIAAGAINNTASADSDQTDPVDDSDTVVPPVPALAIDKAAPSNADGDGNGDLSEGDVLTYTITASNNGSSTLTNLVVSDPMLTPNTITCATVSPGGTCVLSGTYTVTANDVTAGVITNTATADSDQTGPVDDTETVNPPAPALALDKSLPSNTDEDGSGDISIGDTLVYTITATNTGFANLTNLVVNDPMLTPASTVCALVAPAATCVLSGSYSVSAADVSAGSIVNTATANSDQTDPVDDTETVLPPVPSLALDKAVPTSTDVDSSGDISTGDVLTYTVTATNTGTSALTNVVVNDPMLIPNSVTCPLVAPGDDCLLVGSYTVTTTDISNGAINNTATADSDQTPPTDDQQTQNLNGPSHTISKAFTANADEDGTTDLSVNDTLTYTVTATNNGSANLTNVAVTDPMLTPSSIICPMLAPGDSCVLTGTYQVTQADIDAGSILNTASSDTDQTDPLTDSETVITPTPSLSIDKAYPSNADNDGSGDVTLNDVLSYTITVSNNGTAVLTNVVINDPLITPSTQTCPLMTPGAVCLLNGTYTVTQADIDNGLLANTATADSDQTGPASDSENVNIASPDMALAKTLSSNADDDSSGDYSLGDTLTYTIVATNTGAINLTNVVVSDPMLTPASIQCPTLAVGGTCVLTGTYTIAQSDIDQGGISNTATADSDQTPPIDDDLELLLSAPAMDLDKQLSGNSDQDGTANVSLGDTLTYTITATNTGSTTLTNVVVSDPMLTPTTMTCALVAPLNTCVLSGTYNVTNIDVANGTIVNTATADSDQTGAIDDSMNVSVFSPPVTQPVYLLALDKTLSGNADEDGNSVITPGDTLSYTITATNVGNTTLANVVVTDNMIVPSTITCVTLAPADTCVLMGGYVVTAQDAATGQINNTASANSDNTPATFAVDSQVVELPPQSNPPVTTNNSATDQTLCEAVTMDVLADDSDPENNIDPTTVQLIDPATGNGVTTLVVAGEGVWSVDPVSGAITFTPEGCVHPNPTMVNYSVTDTTGQVSNVSQVMITFEEPASLSGYVWLDSDGDGELDAGEELQSGWTLIIFDANGNQVGSTQTDSAGYYEFNDLPPGQYSVQFFDEEGNLITLLDTDGALLAGTTQSLPLPVLPPQDELVIHKTVDRARSSIGGFARYSIRVENPGDLDLNNITITDDLPAGLSYVAGTAMLTREDSFGLVVMQSSVSASGHDPVDFGPFNVPAADAGSVRISYHVRVGSTAPLGELVNTAQVTSGATSNVSSAKIRIFAEPALQQATIIGKVFHDRDADGFQDNADANNVTIHSDYFGWSSYRAGNISGRYSERDPAENHQLVINMPVSDNNRFSVTTKEGSKLSVDHDGTITESHVGDRAHGRTGQDLRIATRKINAVPTPSTRDGEGYSREATDVVQITISNIGIHEEGLPGIRVANVTGLVAETDEYGRFHFPDVDSGEREYGAQHLLKVDRQSLPDGSKFTTENPRLLRITDSTLNTFRFGVKLPDSPSLATDPDQSRLQELSITLGSVFFDTDMHNVREDQKGIVQDIIRRIREVGSGRITIEAHTDSRHTQAYNVELAGRRATTIRDALKAALAESVMSDVTIEVDDLSYQEVPHNDPRALDYRGGAR